MEDMIDTKARYYFELKNGRKYSGTIICEDEIFIEILDKFSMRVRFQKVDIVVQEQQRWVSIT